MATSTRKKPSPHALLLPFPFIGHITPMLQFARCLASAGVFVTLVYSQHPPSRAVRQAILSQIAQFNNNLQQQQEAEDEEQQQQRYRHNIRVKVVPQSLSDDEEESAENGIALILKGSAVLEEQVEKIVTGLKTDDGGLPVSCIVCDTGFDWAQDVADKCGVPRVDFNTSSAASYLLNAYLPLLFSNGYIPFKGHDGDSAAAEESRETLVNCIPGLPWLRVADIPEEYSFIEGILDFATRTAGRGKEAEWVIINTCYALESNALDALRALGIRLHPCGPLFAHFPDNVAGEGAFSPQSDETLRWLDNHEPSSVLYVSLGTNTSLSKAELQALILGLQGSGVPILWALPVETKVDGKPVWEAWPEGLGSSREGWERGRIVAWAPQAAILSHASVGGFLTHCGWNSTMEGVYSGVPMLGLPRNGEQKMNMRLVRDEWGVGMAMGEVTKEGVEEGVRALMLCEDGGGRRKEVKRRAMDVREEVRRGAKERSHNNMRTLDMFIQDLFNRAKSSP